MCKQFLSEFQKCAQSLTLKHPNPNVCNYVLCIVHLLAFINKHAVHPLIKCQEFWKLLNAYFIYKLITNAPTL